VSRSCISRAFAKAISFTIEGTLDALALVKEAICKGAGDLLYRDHQLTPLI